MDLYPRLRTGSDSFQVGFARMTLKSKTTSARTIVHRKIVLVTKTLTRLSVNNGLTNKNVTWVVPPQ